MKTTMVVAAALLASQVALGEELPMVVEENQTVVQVNGMVCSFCAYGAEKALSDLDCLDAADFGNGVFVDIDTQRITLALRPGEKIPFREIYKRIEKSGYDPLTFYLRAEGRLERVGEKLLLTDSKSGQLFSVAAFDSVPLAAGAVVRVQAHFDAEQVSELPEGEAVEITIGRVLSGSSMTGQKSG